MTGRPKSLSVSLSPCLLVILLVFLLASCTSIRPIRKIGLIASFEGLYRRSGYEALQAMRLAIAEAPPGSVELLPLALDDSRDPARTVEKMLADPAVAAVIGPLRLDVLSQTMDRFASAKPRWIVPFAVDPTGGFADVQEESTWLTELIVAVVNAAKQQGALELIVAGLPSGWSQRFPEGWNETSTLPIRIDDDPNALTASSAFLWLGDSAEGAQRINDLYARQPTVKLWLGAQGGDPVFAERLTVDATVYWAMWRDDGYAAWMDKQPEHSPFAYLLYAATRQAIAEIVSSTGAEGDHAWSVQCFEVTRQQTSKPVEFCTKPS